MKRINFKKFGFYRDETKDADFYDDGVHHKVYLVDGADRVIVTKTYCDGQLCVNTYLYGEVECEDVWKLPHFNSVSNPFNGKTNRDEITEQDLEDFHNNCIAFQKEYIEAENKIKNN